MRKILVALCESLKNSQNDFKFSQNKKVMAYQWKKFENSNFIRRTLGDKFHNLAKINLNK